MIEEAVDILADLGLSDEEEGKNKQLFENSPLADLPPHAEALAGRRDPNFAILHEKPEHRIVLLYKLKGYSNREIAIETGYTDAWISQICRQPWFQQRLLKALEETKEEVIDEIVKIEAKNSIFRLVTLRDCARSEDVQARCAIEILNRHLGKPLQKTEIKGTFSHSLTRASEVDEELRRVEDEEKKLLHFQTTGVREGEETDSTLESVKGGDE